VAEVSRAEERATPPPASCGEDRQARARATARGDSIFISSNCMYKPFL
jgi:hypothetical protein